MEFQRGINPVSQTSNNTIMSITTGLCLAITFIIALIGSRLALVGLSMFKAPRPSWTADEHYRAKQAGLAAMLIGAACCIPFIVAICTAFFS